jgi:four helix bundle protein
MRLQRNGANSARSIPYRPRMQDFTKLRVWQLGGEIALRVIEALPARTGRIIPGLRAQAVRAATSVPANIAEGCSRESRQEFLHFVEIALGSHNELDAHLRVAGGAGLISAVRYSSLRGDLDLQRRMLVSLARTLQRRIAEEEHARRHPGAVPSVAED